MTKISTHETKAEDDPRSPRPAGAPRRHDHPRWRLLARGTRTTLGHPGSQRFRQNIAAQRADRLPDTIGRRRRRSGPALRGIRMARIKPAHRPGEFVRAPEDARIRAGPGHD